MLRGTTGSFSPHDARKADTVRYSGSHSDFPKLSSNGREEQSGARQQGSDITNEAQARAAAAVGGGDALVRGQPPHVRLAQAAEREHDVTQRGAGDGRQEVGLVLRWVDARQQLRRAAWRTAELESTLAVSISNGFEMRTDWGHSNGRMGRAQ
jgi:hypothetical protein